MVKIYTKRGDFGETDLFGGGRIKKSNQRIKAYGTVDELTSILGFASSLTKILVIKQAIEEIQNELYILMSDLATPKQNLKIKRINKENTKRLENTIDGIEKYLPKLTKFILPSGSPSGSAIHYARTVCRRAEREVVELSESEKINPEILKYLNRLSDYLFVMARFVNKKEKAKEIKADYE